MLAVFAWEPGQNSGEHKIRLVSSVALGLAIIPLLLVTGARSGIGAAVLAIASIPLVISVNWRRALSRRTVALVAGGFATVALLAWIATLTGRNFALLRFRELDATEDLRFSTWNVSWHLIEKYFPFGSGIGSFEQVFQIDEPTAMLTPRYWNHVHNDWLEVVLVGGLPAMLLLAIAVAGYGVAVFHAFRPGKPHGLTRALARLGCVIITILGLASVFDYPIRTPAAACLFVFAAVLAAKGVGKSNRPANEGL
jgi:O-antigen ligase